MGIKIILINKVEKKIIGSLRKINKMNTFFG